MREQRQESECILNCQRSLRLKSRCTKDQCYQIIFAVVVDEVTELDREDVPCELLYADNEVLMSETTDGLRIKFQKWTEAFESKGLKVNL